MPTKLSFRSNVLRSPAKYSFSLTLGLHEDGVVCILADDVQATRSGLSRDPENGGKAILVADQLQTADR